MKHLRGVFGALAGVATLAWQLGRADADTAEYLHQAYEAEVSKLRVALSHLGWVLVSKVRGKQ